MKAIRPNALARVLALAAGELYSVDVNHQPYRVVCADPAWPFGDKLPGLGRGAEKHYELLTIVDLMGLAFEGGQVFRHDHIADDAYLFLWRVSSMVEEAYRVCRAWEFEPKTEIVWRKQTVNGARHFGMGRHFRAEHETCIVAVRGKPKPLVRNIRSVFDAKAPSSANGRAIHSAKPESFYKDVVEKIARGPYLELFARNRRPGWTCVGKQMPVTATR